MKITFEGQTHQDIFDQMESLLASTNMSRRQASTTDEIKSVGKTSTELLAELKGPGPDVFSDMGLAPVETPVVKTLKTPEAKPAKVRSAKQLENDERLRKLAVEKAAAKKAPAPKAAPAPKPAPEPEPDETLSPADMVALRTRTVAELQEAYANGHQKEVFELLSRYGNGAKSFRELPADAFVPIRKAIDNGALA